MQVLGDDEGDRRVTVVIFRSWLDLETLAGAIPIPPVENLACVQGDRFEEPMLPYVTDQLVQLLSLHEREEVAVRVEFQFVLHRVLGERQPLNDRVLRRVHGVPGGGRHGGDHLLEFRLKPIERFHS